LFNPDFSNKSGLNQPAGYASNQVVFYMAGADGINRACYWTGTNQTILANGGYAKSIYICNGTPYIAGYDGTTACYWTGSKETPLVNGTGMSANSIFVKDGIIYVGGYANISSANYACYWVDNTVVTNGKTGVTYSICLDENNNVFWTGYLYNSPNNFYEENTSGLNDITGCNLQSIFIDNNNTLYIAGQDNSSYACFWKGSSLNETILSNKNGLPVTGPRVLG